MFTNFAIRVALAIVHIFEASKPLGDFSAVAVLDDGAGISYGMNQFTHKSRSLLAVVNKFLGKVDGKTFDQKTNAAIAKIRSSVNLLSSNQITTAANDSVLKNALKLVGKLAEMQSAQTEVMTEKYLQPAITACNGSNFVLPMSLAVIYDSHNQGSFAKIRDRVRIKRKDFNSDLAFEKAWIKEYCQERNNFLGNLPKKSQKASVYRPKFFLAEIAAKNWDLKLPMNVHGHKLTAAQLGLDADDIEQITLDETEEIEPTAPVVEEDLEPDNDEDKLNIAGVDFSEIIAEPFQEKTDEIGDTITDLTDKADSAISQTKETVRETIDEGNKQIEKTATEVKNNFNPETYTQYIPQIGKARKWLGGGFLVSLLSTFAAKFAGLPDWLIFVFGVVTGIALAGLIWLIVTYSKQITSLVQTVVKINADPTQHNLILTSDINEFESAALKLRQAKTAKA